MRILVCTECRDPVHPWRERTWRYPCIECADQFVTFHQGEFPGHRVNVIARDESTWEAMQQNLEGSRRLGW